VVITTQPGRAARLRDALYSVAALTHPGVCAIVVLQSADPGDRARVDELTHHLCGLLEVRVVAVENARGGVEELREAGLASARGELVCLLDDGDVLYPQFAAVLGGALDAHPACAAARGACVHATGRVEEHGFVVETKAPAPDGTADGCAVLHRRDRLHGDAGGEVVAVPVAVAEHRIIAARPARRMPLRRLARRLRRLYP
jgi:hypothetical protein